MGNSEVLTQSSVEKLRHYAQNDKANTLDLEFDKLVEVAELNFVGWLENLPEKVSLIHEKSIPDSIQDANNSLLIYKTYSDFTPAMASDERLWVTLSFREYSEYAKSRWLKGTDSAKDFNNHFFASTMRDRWRNNAIARLWWSGWIANSSSDLSPEDAIATLYCNSDFIYSLMGRSSIASMPQLLNGILNLAFDNYGIGEQTKFDRNNFRKFLKEVDLLSGKIQLPVLGEEEFRVLLNRLWINCHK
jgi:hypothetical protein